MNPNRRMDHLPRALGGLIVAVLVGGAQPSALQGTEEPAAETAEPYRGAPVVPDGPLVSRGPEPDVAVLFTSSVRGYYQPCG